jgi:hypothetical protein
LKPKDLIQFPWEETKAVKVDTVERQELFEKWDEEIKAKYG